MDLWYAWLVFANWLRCREKKKKKRVRNHIHTLYKIVKSLIPSYFNPSHPYFFFPIPILVQNLLIFTKNQPRFLPKLSLHDTQHIHAMKLKTS